MFFPFYLLSYFFFVKPAKIYTLLLFPHASPLIFLKVLVALVILVALDTLDKSRQPLYFEIAP